MKSLLQTESTAGSHIYRDAQTHTVLRLRLTICVIRQVLQQGHIRLLVGQIQQLKWGWW